MDSDRRIYHISPWRRAVLWSLLGPFAALGLALWVGGDDAATRTAGAVVLAIMTAFLAAWHWLLARTYVALTTVGVELHQLGMNMRAAWPDIAALSLRRGREGFIVRTPLEGAGAARIAALRGFGAFGAPLYDEEQRELLGERRFIPIEAFAWHARHGTLVREVARLAPHVSIGDEADVPANASRTGVAWATVIILVAIGIGLAFADSGYLAMAVVIVQALAAPLGFLGSAVNAARALRARLTLIGGLFLALALVTLGWTFVAWQQLVRLLDS